MVTSDTGQMAGKTVVVTGGTGGIGLQTALALARLGARVVITGRDGGRAQSAAARIGGDVDVLVADMSSLHQVRGLAADLLGRHPRIDVLVNNVGGYWNTRHVTTDGLERTFALNHLTPFLLTNLLQARLTAAGGARVVTVSSNAHTMGRIDFDDLQAEHRYSGARAYNQSKLANVLFSYELGRRLQGQGVTANALHPGVVRTGFGSEDPGGLQKLLVPLGRWLMKSPEQGAKTSVYLASSPDVQEVSGRYFVNNKPKKSAPASYDETTARRLWDVSVDLVGGI